MISFQTIDALIEAVEQGRGIPEQDIPSYRKILSENKDAVKLMRSCNRLYPNSQIYFLKNKLLLLGTEYPFCIFRFSERFKLEIKITVIGFHDIFNVGCLVAKDDRDTEANLYTILQEVADRNKGITVALNLGKKLAGSIPFLPIMVIANSFTSFEDYLGAFKHKYRYNLMKHLKQGQGIKVRRLGPGEFGEVHYSLYRSVYERALDRGDALPINYFRNFEEEFFEFIDAKGRLLAITQIREMDGKLFSLRIGFHKYGDGIGSEKGSLSSVNLYFNILAYVIRYGIERGYKRIELGPSAENAKSRLGAVKEMRYMYVTSSNPFVRFFFRHFLKNLMKDSNSQEISYIFKNEVEISQKEKS